MAGPYKGRRSCTRAAMSEAVKPLGEADRATTASDDGAHAGLVEIDAADDGFADL